MTDKLLTPHYSAFSVILSFHNDYKHKAIPGLGLCFGYTSLHTLRFEFALIFLITSRSKYKMSYLHKAIPGYHTVEFERFPFYMETHVA